VPRLQLINHSCIIIGEGNDFILCDPYLSGSCFNNGWDLIVKTRKEINNYSFNYIWYSHEHSDHFSPRDLKLISDLRRNSTTILYQKTKDKKLYNYCKNLGFPVLELRNYNRFNVNSEFSFTGVQHRDSDSWGLFEISGKKVLNLNDCFIYKIEELEKLKKDCGEIDVLLTQYSFANWVGNKDDIYTPPRIAEWYLKKVENQVKILNPKFVIPFASFVFFSNEENNYLNNYIVTIHDFYEMMKQHTSQPIILFPEDHWDLSSDFDNTESLRKWKSAYKSISTRILNPVLSKTFTQLQEAFDQYRQRIKKKNSWFLLKLFKFFGFLPSSLVYLNDLDKIISFDIIAGISLVTDKKLDDCDISLSSDSFHYILSHEWGRGTLQINGRFQAISKNFVNFIRQTQIAFANNIGKTFPFSLRPGQVNNPPSFVLKVVEGKHELHS